MAIPISRALQHVFDTDAAARSKLGQIIFGVALALAMTVAYVLLALFGSYHWMIANGVLFTALWMMPRRVWPWLFIASMVARVINGIIGDLNSGITGPFLGYWSGPIQFTLGNLLEPFLLAVGVLALQRWKVMPGMPATMNNMGRLHLAAALSALAVVCKDLGYVFNDGWVAEMRLAHIFNPVPISGPGASELLVRFAIKNFLGDFIGIMLIAPFAFWLARPASRAGSKSILRDALLYPLPILVLFVTLGAFDPGTRLAEMLRLLLMVAVVVFAMRNGWRGAAISILAASMAITLEEYLGHPALNPIWMQLFIAITGAMALLFGATVDGMREHTELLMAANHDTVRLAAELHAAAVRNLQAEERERQRLAAELHDEFGQTLTAMQTHLKLAEKDFRAINRQSVSDTLLDLTRRMRHNITSVLDALRPAALDELGLYGAIERGSVRRLAEDAGLTFESRIEGDARLLSLFDEATRVAAYRLVQEGVTNVVRHARATHCHVRLRVDQRSGALWLFIEVRDDGIGGFGHLKPGRGLSNMRDRVLALGGRLHLHDDAFGVRLHALLRQSLAY